MTARYARPLTAQELAALPDSEIDFSDIPRLDEAFWTHAQVRPPRVSAVRRCPPFASAMPDGSDD